MLILKIVIKIMNLSNNKLIISIDIIIVLFFEEGKYFPVITFPFPFSRWKNTNRKE